MDKKPLTDTFGTIGNQMNVIFDSIIKRRMDRRRAEFARDNIVKESEIRANLYKRFGTSKKGRWIADTQGIDADYSPWDAEGQPKE